ncbi:MAG: CRTAC1 family protein [Gemmatimonadota bacterium]
MRAVHGGSVLLAWVAALAACGRGEPATSTPPAEYAESADAAADPAQVIPPLRFVDVTHEAGIVFTHETGAFGAKWMPETMGSGGGFLDYDGDGWPDLFLVNGMEWPGHETDREQPTPRLYRNRGDGRFDDVTRQAGLDLTVYGMGSAFADYDADGDPDIYLTAVGDNLLLRNDGGRFTDVAAAAGVLGNGDEPGAFPAWSTAAAWLDVDRDGWLDLFVCNYVRWTPATDLFTTLDGKTKSYATPQPYEGESCRLYRNREGRRFDDVTASAGVLNRDGKSLGIAVSDFNDDGWPDLVVANDTERNFLYLNDGDGTFTDIALRAGVGYDEFGRARAGMGIDVAEVIGEDRLSIAIGNFSREPVSLYTQIGDDLFLDRAGAAGLTNPTLLPLTFGLRFVDVDLDGHRDLLLANGHIEPAINTVQREITFAQPPQLLHNDGRGHLHDITVAVGGALAEPVVGRGLAAADIDRDGDADLLITVNGGAPKLLRNDLPAGANWMRLRLRGNAPNLDAIGAVVTVHAGDLHQRRMVRTGSSYLSQSEMNPLVFGLGAHSRADSTTVRWPTTGDTLRLGPLRAGREYVISESSGLVVMAERAGAVLP